KRLTVLSVIFMPINVIAGMGGMSEFSMMTEGIPWPIAYTGFACAMVAIGALTYYGLRHFERRRISAQQQTHHHAD
ncbi:MAG: magnesium transporter CorA, partial [Candidatus Accumulibacter sp.]|nr:magnesium transporter CorA [Accumulibacter sp.]